MALPYWGSLVVCDDERFGRVRVAALEDQGFATSDSGPAEDERKRQEMVAIQLSQRGRLEIGSQIYAG